MRIYTLLKDIAKSILPAGVEKRIEPPDTYQAGEAYGFDTLAMRYIQQSSGRGIEQVTAECVLMFYLSDVNIDSWITDMLKKLSYTELQNILQTYNEVVAITVDKIVVYALNAFHKRAIAIHLSVVSNI